MPLIYTKWIIHAFCLNDSPRTRFCSSRQNNIRPFAILRKLFLFWMLFSFLRTCIISCLYLSFIFSSFFICVWWNSSTILFISWRSSSLYCTLLSLLFSSFFPTRQSRKLYFNFRSIHSISSVFMMLMVVSVDFPLIKLSLWVSFCLN